MTAGGRAAALLALLVAGGCHSAGAISGAAAGGATGAVTANPLVGYAVAVGINAGVDALQQYIARVRQGSEQDVIAAAVGEMGVNETRPWEIVHTIPLFDDEHGEMRVVRLIDTPLTQCKEVLFTVDGGAAANAIYATDACRWTDGWKWAEPEPAIARWGYLQHISH